MVLQFAWIIYQLLNLAIVLKVRDTVAETLDSVVFTCGPGASEVMIHSETSGIFQSPGWPDTFTPGSGCLFRFMAPPAHKMFIEFNNFNIEGPYPYCHRDFLDVYIDVASSNPRNEEEVRFLAYLQEAQGPKTTTPFVALLFSSILSRSRLLGRFCNLEHHSGVGTIPQRFVSIYREIILDFFAATSPIKTDGKKMFGFNGTFKIIPDDSYYPGKVASAQDIPFIPQAFLSTQLDEPICRFIIQPKPKSGEIVSPAYPGFHPPGLQCIYAFRGQPNHRIRINIIELGLPSQLNTCSTDYIEFFDGNNMLKSPSIGDRMCGERKDIQIFSSDSSLTMYFATASTTNDVPFSIYSGFRISYEFWDRFVQIEPDLMEWHIRGTECDFTIRSGWHAGGGQPIDGALELPNVYSRMTLAPSHTCTFFFLGRREEQRKELVLVAFDLLDLPPFNQSERKCTDGYMAVYGARITNDENFDLHPTFYPKEDSSNIEFDWNLGLQSTPISLEALPRPSQIWCGDKLSAITTKNDVDRSPLVSLRSTLALRFNASGKTSMTVRLRAFYKFVSDYGIAGLMVAPNKCWFIYSGKDHRESQVGWTNSPFFDKASSPSSNCLYLFHIETDQSLLLSFTAFQIAKESDTIPFGGNRLGQRLENCTTNYLNINELHTEVNDEKNLFQKFASGNSQVVKKLNTNEAMVSDNERLKEIYSFCGDYIPGPLIPSAEAKAILLAFRTDEKNMADGFQLKFRFLPKLQSLPIVEDLYISGAPHANELGGVLQSPGYPVVYPKSLNRQWKLSVKQPAKGILIQFTEISMEGTIKECKNAVIRITLGDFVRPMVSICGFASNIPAFVTNHPSIIISMLTTEDAEGGKGFKLIWTKLLPLDETGKCQGFLCKHSRHCIANEMECNELPNCGTYYQDGRTVTDTSDEITHCLGSLSHSSIHIGAGILITIVISASIMACVIYREKQRKRKKAHDPLENIPGAENEDVDLQSPGHKTIRKKEQPPSLRLPVDIGFHRCQKLLKNQTCSSTLHNGTVGHTGMQCHQNAAHYCSNEPVMLCSLSGNSLNSSSSSPNNLGNFPSSSCLCDHTLPISSQPLSLYSPRQNPSYSRTKETSFVSNAKERIQKISIV